MKKVTLIVTKGDIEVSANKELLIILYASKQGKV